MNHIETIYLDNGATTPLSKSMKEYLIQVLDNYGNPSSLHSVGQNAKRIVNSARKTVAKFINANPEDIYFTSGGSASNTLAIKGYCQKHDDCRILYSPIVHSSILKCVESYRKKQKLNVDSNGFIDIYDLKIELEKGDCGDHPFVIIGYADSEIGTIQKDIKDIIELVHSHDGVVYLDCTGSIPTIPLDVKALDVDTVGFSGHKINALKGCGVLYKKKNIELAPLIYGSQEHGLIGGTENVLGIASLAKAIEELDYHFISSENRDYVYHYIMKNIPDSYLVGAPIGKDRLPHNLYMCFKGIEGESLMLLLDMNGVEVSTGSACTSGSIKPSSTLTAIGMDEDDIHSCIRMTFSGSETSDEMDYVCKKLKDRVDMLRALWT